MIHLTGEEIVTGIAGATAVYLGLEIRWTRRERRKLHEERNEYSAWQDEWDIEEEQQPAVTPPVAQRRTEPVPHFVARGPATEVLQEPPREETAMLTVVSPNAGEMRIPVKATRTNTEERLAVRPAPAPVAPTTGSNRRIRADVLTARLKREQERDQGREP